MMLTSLIIGISSIAILYFGVLAIIKNRDNSQLNVSFLSLTIFMSGWLVCGLIMHHQLVDDVNPIVTARVSMSFASFIAASFLAFALTFSARAYRHQGFLIKLVYTLAGVSTIMSMAGIFMRGIRVVNHAAVREFGRLSMLFALFVVACVVSSTYILIQTYRTHSSPVHRLRAKYVLLGVSSSLLISICFCLVMPLLGANKLFFVGHLSTVVLMFCIAYAVVKQRLMVLNVVFTRAAIFTFVYLALLAVPLWVGYTKQMWDAALGLMIILAVPGPVIYHFLASRAEERLLFRQKRYHKFLGEFVDALAAERDPDLLLQMVVRIIRGSAGINFVAAFLYDKQNNVFNLAESSNIPDMPADMVIHAANPVAQQTMISHDPFIIEELRAEAQLSLGFPLRASLVVPLRISNDVIGLLVLGDKNDGSIWIEEDLAVFKRLAHQISLEVKNAVLIAELQKAREKLFNAEKVAMTWGMAEGAAHQIGHRLNDFAVIGHQLGVRTAEITEMSANVFDDKPAFYEKLKLLAKYSESIKGNVKKTLKVIEMITNFAQAREETELRGIPFKEVLQEAADITKLKLGVSELPLHTTAGDKDTVYGIRGQILDCMISCICNAAEAIMIKEKYKLSEEEKRTFIPRLDIAVTQSQKTTQIKVSDNGEGIKEENKSKVFSAFYTTKTPSEANKGISMYVVKRMIEENHKGRIWFESEYTRGTTFFIEFPRKTLTAI